MPVLFVDNLTSIDCTLLHPGRGLAGASWNVDIELHGNLDAQGMVLDFGDAKKILKREIDRRIDHRLLVPAALDAVSCVELPDGNLRVEMSLPDGHLRVEAPPAAVLRVPAPAIEPEGLGTYLSVILRSALPACVTQLVVRLREERIDGPFFCYSHGLKKHGGACQRIAHGHRSRIEIEENGKRNPVLERRWAARFLDIYIGSTPDLAPQQRNAHFCFAYSGTEGRFTLELPAARVYLIDNDSTVEHIAQHIAQSLKRDNPQNRYRVKAWEGIGKGAIATA